MYEAATNRGRRPFLRIPERRFSEENPGEPGSPALIGIWRYEDVKKVFASLADRSVAV